MGKDRRGMIVVETLGSFVLFVFLVISILTLVNIVSLQARVHYALTQTAETLSMYSYVLNVTGIAQGLIDNDAKADGVRKEADAFKSDINGIIDGAMNFRPSEVGRHGDAALNRASGWIGDTMDDPKATSQLLLNYFLSEGRNAAFGLLARALVGRYLANGDMSGDQYLKSVNVAGGLDGIEFYDFSLFGFEDEDMGDNDSVLLDANGDVKLTARYGIDYKFGALPLPFPTLRVTQIVRTKAWLKGSGDGYAFD
jgi:hypothetical protein